MNRRAMTLEEIKALVEELAGKVTAEGAELYANLKIKIDKLADDAEMELAVIQTKMKDVRIELEMLMDKVSMEGQELIKRLEVRLDDLRDDIEEELAELEEKGLVRWIKDNKKLAVGLAAVVVVVVAAVVVLL